ncbi:MAG: beta-galactosidase, partial [Armatimonadota bacterium]
FVEVRIWDTGYALQATKHFLLYAAGTEGARPADLGKREGEGGFLDVRTDPPSHVFAPGQELSFRLQVRLPPLSGERSLHISLTDYGFKVLKEETHTVPDTASGVWETNVAFPAHSTEACRALVQLRVAGKLVDQDSLILGRPAGRRREAAKPRAAEPRPVSAKDTGTGATASAFLVYGVPPAGLDTLARVGRGMDQAVLSGNQFVEIQVPWADLEPLPGLYQFALLDKILDLAQDKGLKVKLAPWYLADHAPRWLFACPACYEDGSSAFIGGSHFVPSPSNPFVQQSIVRLWETIARRYRDHPALAGYLVVGPSLDLGYWHNGLLHTTDYSPTMLASYRRYLSEVCHHSLAAISQRYGQTVDSWDAVFPPQKDWTQEVDLRPQWVDFLAYQQWELYQWMEREFRVIREQDPVHTVTQYQMVSYGPQEYYYPLFQKYHIEATTGGSESADYQRFVSLYHLWGLRSRGGETIQTVDRWNLQRSIFNMLAYGGDGGYYAVQWHNVFPEPWDAEPDGPAQLERWSAVQGVGGWLKRVKKINFSPDYARWSPIIEELGKTQPLPPQAGCLSSYANCQYTMRSLLPYWVSGAQVTRAWMEKEHHLPLWISDTTPLGRFRDLKLLVADADIPVMSRATAQNLTAYVKAGGCLVTFAATGRYTVETGKSDFGFLAGLGFSTPEPMPQSGAAIALHGTSLLAGVDLVFRNLDRVHAPPGTEVLGGLSDGTPCVLRRSLGAGEVILFLGELDWEQSGQVLGALCRQRQVAQWCDAEASGVGVYALRQGETRYVLAYAYPDKRQSAGAGEQRTRARVKLHCLDAPAYRVTELGHGRDLGDFTAQQLESGLQTELQSGELQVFRCTPVPSAPKAP